MLNPKDHKYSSDDIKGRKPDRYFHMQEEYRSVFKSLPNQLEFSGTPYRIQLGHRNYKWAFRLLRGDTVIDECACEEDDLSNPDFPRRYLLKRWLARLVIVQDINPFHFMNSLQKSREQLIEANELSIHRELEQKRVEYELKSKSFEERLRIKLAEVGDGNDDILG